MTTLIEQAILEANQLREAAESTAKDKLHQLYAEELKKSIESLLEQEEPDENSPMNLTDPSSMTNPVDAGAITPTGDLGMGTTETPTATPPAPLPVDPSSASSDKETKSSIFDQIDYAFKNGETINGKHYDNGLVEIDLESLDDDKPEEESDESFQQLAESLFDEGYVFEDDAFEDNNEDMFADEGMIEEKDDFDDLNNGSTSQSDGDIDAEIERILRDIDSEEGGDVREDMLFDPKSKKEAEKNKSPVPTPMDGPPVSDYERKVMESLNELTDDDFEDEMNNEDFEQSQFENINEETEIDIEDDADEHDNQWNGITRGQQNYFKQMADMKRELNSTKKDNNANKVKNIKLSMKLKEAVEIVKKLEEKNNILLEEVEKINKNFDETQFLNFKLLYINKALMENSLNERQKIKIVETITEVKTREEAKLVFETFIKTASGSENNRSTKTLSESLLNGKAMQTLKPKNVITENNDEDKVFSRYQKLAGITR